MKARLVGYRRGRDFTPNSTEPNRNKFVCVEDSPAPQPLNFCIEGASSSTTTETTLSDHDTWTLERYVQARQFSARQRFWQAASEAAKQRMVLALYAQPSGSAVTVQARENGWIPL